MNNNRTLKYLLLQARTDEMCKHEQSCFERCINDPIVEFDVINLFNDNYNYSQLTSYDAVIFGGSGEFSVTTIDKKWLNQVMTLIQRILEDKIPLFGSCFGHQLLALSLGANVETRLEQKEVGTYSLELTQDGKNNPLFSKLPERFDVQLGHQDFVVELPKGCKSLASTLNCEHQAFQFENLPVFTTQFHPELNFNDMIKRINYYASHGYVDKDQDVEMLKKQFKESTHSDQILRNFHEIILNLKFK